VKRKRPPDDVRQVPALDVSHLPSTAFGPRAPMWWGIMGMIAIESTVFAIMAAAYFYLRGGEGEWPPPGTANPSLWLATANLLVLLASAYPIHRANEAAEKEDVSKTWFWLAVATVLGVAFFVGRLFELGAMTYSWSSNAFGSVVWTTMGLHTVHLIASIAENVVFLVLLIRGPVEDKHMVDVTINGIYWYFVVLSWVPFYAMFYLDPGLFRP
jgi:cytochrome c oxidase subunit 3